MVDIWPSLARMLCFGHKLDIPTCCVAIVYLITSGDENHLCGASLCESHKISLKAHRHHR